MLTGLEENWPLLLLIVAWSLPWKGVALWRAANRGDKRWFIAILVLNTLAILDIIYIFFVARDKGGHGLAKARAKIQKNKREAKKKVLELFSSKKRITNDDVQGLLGVSDATATRYLDELEKEGKIIQKGSKRGVFYTPK